MLWYSLEAPQHGASNEYPQHMYLPRNKKNITVKSLTDARAFIRIITFQEEGDGRLLEAIETCKSHIKVQNDQFLSNGRHLVFSENDW